MAWPLGGVSHCPLDQIGAPLLCHLPPPPARLVIPGQAILPPLNRLGTTFSPEAFAQECQGHALPRNEVPDSGLRDPPAGVPPPQELPHNLDFLAAQPLPAHYAQLWIESKRSLLHRLDGEIRAER